MSLTEQQVNPTQPAPLRAICIALHDVAPQTQSRCEQWLRAIHAVANVPVTFLAVPDYHRYRIIDPTKFDRFLEHRVTLGDEIALHGYSHLDEGGRDDNFHRRLIRQVYTRGEAEFYAIDADEAKRRMEMGIFWLERHNWPVTGFVAPAWLLGKGGWQALQGFPFKYTTTMRRFYLLPERVVVPSANIVYSVRNSWRRTAWRAANAVIYQTSRHTPLVRLGLHPDDVLHPDIVRQTQKFLAAMLDSRVPMTKIAFADRWRHVVGPYPQSTGMPVSHSALLRVA